MPHERHQAPLGKPHFESMNSMSHHHIQLVFEAHF
jgi:hypothetical protein